MKFADIKALALVRIYCSMRQRHARLNGKVERRYGARTGSTGKVAIPEALDQ